MQISLEVGQVHDVTISTLAFGGAGLSRDLGIVCFVPFSAIGDKLKVRLTAVKKNLCEAEILEVLSPSPDRQAAPCPYYQKCGGCNFQHLSYAAQLRAKEEILRGIFKKQLKQTAVNLLPIIASPKQLHYRNRISVKLTANAKGYFARGSHDIVPIEKCLLAEEELNQELSKLSANKDISEVQNISIKKLLNLQVQTQLLNEEDESLGFSQVNSAMNELMVAEVLKAFPESWDLLADLYGGSGNFSFPLAEANRFKNIHCVELNSQASALGRQLSESKQSPIQFIHADVATYLKLLKAPESFAVILDPPRQGCSENVLNFLLQQKPKRIVYISCNPTTLARDLEILFSKGKDLGLNLRLSPIQPLDMFPQTDHVECLARIDSI